MVSIRLLESNKEIVAKINRGLAKEFDARMRKKSALILGRLKPIIANALFASPEINSLQGGALKFDFGLIGDPGPQIVSAVVNSVQLKTEQSRGNANGITGGFSVYVQPSDYSNLLSISMAAQSNVPWLEWLLTAGDAIIIADFGVEYGAGLGRSGGAHMVPLSRSQLGPFKVNSAFSGTVNNNFITRALSKVSRQMAATIKGAL